MTQKSPDPVPAPSPSPPSQPVTTSKDYTYPFAAAPDIIRSYQKDTYFQSRLHEHLSSILRKLYGSRFAHTYSSEARTLSELLYLGLTTLVGNRTLGEEYCDVIQISDRDLRLPSFERRAGYILSSILLPYILTRILPAFRNRVRLKLENSQRKKNSDTGSSTKKSFCELLQLYILTNLSTLTSPSLVYALTLSTFYFSGSYYHLSKRLFGLRYVFTKRLAPSDQRVGYEVLGLLLALQMAVQGWIHIHSTLQLPTTTTAAPSSSLALDATTGGKEGSRRFEATTHTSRNEKPRYDLSKADMMGWIPGPQQRKCTLCLEPMKDPSVTTCGHVFCWTCIADWIREKPECPLCRQDVLGQHVLPLRG